MAGKELKTNVVLSDGTWVGPDYPDAKVSGDQATELGDHVYADAEADPRYGEVSGDPKPHALIGESKDAPAAKTAQAEKPEG
jgi:hypothetical protein